MAKKPQWTASITHPKKRDTKPTTHDSEGEALEAARARFDKERDKWRGATLVISDGKTQREYST